LDITEGMAFLSRPVTYSANIRACANSFDSPAGAADPKSIPRWKTASNLDVTVARNRRCEKLELVPLYNLCDNNPWLQLITRRRRGTC
jgi:hypothetical protein